MLQLYQWNLEPIQDNIYKAWKYSDHNEYQCLVLSREYKDVIEELY